MELKEAVEILRPYQTLAYPNHRMQKAIGTLIKHFESHREEPLYYVLDGYGEVISPDNYKLLEEFEKEHYIPLYRTPQAPEKKTRTDILHSCECKTSDPVEVNICLTCAGIVHKIKIL